MERRGEKAAIRELKTGTKVTYKVLKPVVETFGKYVFEKALRARRMRKFGPGRRIL